MRQRWLAKRQRRSDGSAGSELEDNSLHSFGSVGEASAGFGDLSLEDLDIPTARFSDAFLEGAKEFNADRLDGFSEFDFVEDDGVSKEPVNFTVEDGTGQASSSSAGHGLPTSNLTASAFRVTEFGQFKYPWEKGHLKKVLGNDVGLPSMPSMKPTDRHFLPLKVVVEDHAKMTPEIEVADLSNPVAVFVQVVKKGSNVAYLQERKNKREHALTLWWGLLSRCKKYSAVGRKIALESSESEESAYAAEVLDMQASR